MNQSIEASTSGCGGCGLNRRSFLKRCMACAAGGAGLLAHPTSRADTVEPGRPKVRLVFSEVPMPQPTWPYTGFDFEPRKREVVEMLRKGCPNVAFLPVTIKTPEEASKVAADNKDIDGYLLYFMSLWNTNLMPIPSTGRPTLMVDYLFGGSGEFLMTYAAARRRALHVSCVSSSRDTDIVEAARCFEILKKPGGSPAAFVAACDAVRRRNTKPVGDMACKPDPIKATDISECLKRLKQSTMLILSNDQPAIFGNIERFYGIRTVSKPVEDLLPLYERADRDEARQIADRWIDEAETVVEPTRETIEKAARIYLAMRALMKQHHADAIGVNCIYANWGAHIPAYVCLGFHQLNNEGLVAVCEADLLCAPTMLMMRYLVDRPGFVSDPVIDTSTNRIIYAHCVAPSRVFGPNGPANPYRIRTNAEPRAGSTAQSIMPIGYMTTTVEFNTCRKDFAKEVLLHQGKTVANDETDRACRNKLAVEVKGDIEKLLYEWDEWSWHRVTFYGDLKEPVKELARALKMKVVEEA
ncbi:MAG: twin-arginine translocation signal domain-containing protein [Phycisphaerae bacterium]